MLANACKISVWLFLIALGLVTTAAAARLLPAGIAHSNSSWSSGKLTCRDSPSISLRSLKLFAPADSAPADVQRPQDTDSRRHGSSETTCVVPEIVKVSDSCVRVARLGNACGAFLAATYMLCCCCCCCCFCHQFFWNAGLYQKGNTRPLSLVAATVHENGFECKINQLLANTQVACNSKLGVICMALLALLCPLLAAWYLKPDSPPANSPQTFPTTPTFFGPSM